MGGRAVTGGGAQVRVFVNYRREDTRHVAGRLRDLVVTRFGDGSVFVDVESIEPGVDYVQAIDGAVSGCDVMLVLIGDRWLAPDEQGLRRIDDPADRLRLEIEAGLRHVTRVIPVLVDAARMPKARDLPESLQPLARHHAVRLDHESFRQDVDHLLDVIERIARGTPATGDPRPPDPGPVASGLRARLRLVRGTRVPGSGQARRAPRARWLCLGLLLLSLLVLLAMRAGVAEAVVASRRDLLGDTGTGTVVWLLPAVPVAAAAWWVGTRRRPGVAAGCLVAASLWIVVSLVYVVWRGQDATVAHLLALLPVLGALAALVVAEEDLREPVRRNPWRRTTPALGWLAAAVVLRVQARRIARALLADPPPTWFGIALGPPFWVAALLPLLVGLPAALLRLNRSQAEALLAVAWLQVAYPVVLRGLALPGAAAEGALARSLIEAAAFVAGSLCVVLAVRAAQPARR